MTLEKLAKAAEAAQEKAWAANNAAWAAWQAAQSLADAARALVNEQSEPVATIFMDQHGRQQIEFITTIPVGETIRLYAEPMSHSSDLLLVAKMVRDECHKAWVSSWENFRSDVDLNKIIGAVLEKNSRFGKLEESKEITR